MTDFTTWLRGFADAIPYGQAPTPEQWAMIKARMESGIPTSSFRIPLLPHPDTNPLFRYDPTQCAGLAKVVGVIE